MKNLTFYDKVNIITNYDSKWSKKYYDLYLHLENTEGYFIIKHIADSKRKILLDEGFEIVHNNISDTIGIVWKNAKITDVNNINLAQYMNLVRELNNESELISLLIINRATLNKSELKLPNSAVVTYSDEIKKLSNEFEIEMINTNTFIRWNKIKKKSFIDKIKIFFKRIF